MSPIQRWRLKNQLRVAARLHAAGDLTDAYYAALAVWWSTASSSMLISWGSGWVPCAQ